MTRFYTGIPSHIHSPMWASYWSNRVLAMKRNGICVITRPIRYKTEIVQDSSGTPELMSDGSSKQIIVPHEKGVDVRLALDIVSLARRRQFDIALIFSQDQYLQEVVPEIWDIAKEQNRWIKMVCAFPVSEAGSSARGIEKTDWCRMDRAFYDQHLDPNDYRPKRRSTT